jgi:16S rRNA (guanine966-N2)-methyltransferase
MRVISGSAKGLQLQAVPGRGTRPISDRVKEAVFNILGDSIVGSRVLDLFAGTGSVGIEALSRGAEVAVFVEKHPRAIATIRSNLRHTSLETGSRVFHTDVFKFLAGPPETFDLIYIAPPQWLNPCGVAIVQIFPKEMETMPLTNLQLTDERKYGSTLLCFYEPSSP